jgi:shikimate kinase
VWLVGMMGAGKSTVGRRLAGRLGRRFVDTDAEIERSAGRSVREIFAEEGEAGFRARERDAVEALLGSGAVVALGGGAMAQGELRSRLRGHGPVVHLRVSPERVLERLGDAGERPLLAGLSPAQRLERLEALMRERAAAYADADLGVDTDARSEDEVADDIAARLEIFEREALEGADAPPASGRGG